jgi:hypothetical protein
MKTEKDEMGQKEEIFYFTVLVFAGSLAEDPAPRAKNTLLVTSY